MNRVEPEVFKPLQSALRAGYESRLKWPESYEGQIDTFQAARRLWVANYLAQFERAALQEYIDWLVPQFEYFLETGMIRRF